MVIDNTSTNPVKYVESNLYVSGKGPTRWFASTTAAHQELWGSAVFGLNRSYATKDNSTTEITSAAVYERSTSGDTGALQVIANTGNPTSSQVKLEDVQASIPDIAVGDYVKVKA